MDVRSLRELPELEAARQLFAEVWAGRDGNPLPRNVLCAFALAGCYVAGAWDGERLVGASAGFLADDGTGLHLHSQITAVSPARRDRGVGFALKQHQRSWCLEHGLDVIRWTFDPLVRRNAWFNLNRLGAVGVRYLPDFYGPMDDVINAGDETDRVLVEWHLSRGSTAPTTPAADRRLVPTPDDIEAVRRTEPAEARRWRHDVRASMDGAMAEGYVATKVTDLGEYVMERL